uniref:Uncharacterized protein n=1 Tax=Arundo donax TaxID=35708 RepID=A0A0A9AC59_ARUDO
MISCTVLAALMPRPGSSRRFSASSTL